MAVPNGLAAPSNGEQSTQKINAAGAGVTLPSRPTSKPAAAPQPPAQAPAQIPAPALGGPPAAAPPRATDEAAFGGRGGLGSGWESSGSFAAPTPAAPPAGSQWGGDGMATGRLQAPAAPAASSGWGNGVGNAPPAPGGWGAPAGNGSLGSAPPGAGPSGGWGAQAGGPGGGGGLAGAPAASGFGAPGLGGGGGLGGPPSPSSWGAPAAPSGPAQSNGGGWLGDGGGGGGVGNSGPVYAPPSTKGSESWLGGGDAPAAPSSLAPPPAVEMPLELPDHTVAVDLGTPWEEDEVGGGGSSNKMIYMILGCLVLSLTVFSAYLYWQNSKLHTSKPSTASTDKDATSFKLGEDTWKKAQADFSAKRYEEAQASAELARDLLVPLKGYPKAKQVAAFYNKATNRLAQSYFDQAKRANAAHETNQAIALCTQAATTYGKVKGTAKQQAQAYAYEAGIYRELGDTAGAEASYKKAHSLSPGSGYDAQARSLRAASAPVPPAPAPSNEPPPQVEQPSVGDGGMAYPSGTGSHGYHSSAPAPAPAAVPSGPAPKPRPVNTYVPPPKKQSQRKSDQLPTY